MPTEGRFDEKQERVRNVCGNYLARLRGSRATVWNASETRGSWIVSPRKHGNGCDPPCRSILPKGGFESWHTQVTQSEIDALVSRLGTRAKVIVATQGDDPWARSM